MTLPLEQQVCSLDLAKRLKELAVKQESVFYYNSETDKLQKGFTSHTNALGIHHWSVSAFTVAEFGEMLGKASRKSFEIAYCEVMALVPADVEPVQQAHNLST